MSAAITNDDSNRYFDSVFARTQIMAILRGLPPAQTVALCHTAWAMGIEMVEVPVQGEAGLNALRAAVAAASEQGRTVGAGTVLSSALADRACAAGAAFTVAPGLDKTTAQASLDAGMPHLPGVATATEIQRALAFGFTWLKAFPAAQLTPGWFTAQLAPFPELCLVATGGVGGGNAAQFLAGGARVIAVGSALNDPTDLDRLRSLGVTRSPGVREHRR